MDLKMNFLADFIQSLGGREYQDNQGNKYLFCDTTGRLHGDAYFTIFRFLKDGCKELAEFTLHDLNSLHSSDGRSAVDHATQKMKGLRYLYGQGYRYFHDVEVGEKRTIFRFLRPGCPDNELEKVVDEKDLNRLERQVHFSVTIKDDPVLNR